MWSAVSLSAKRIGRQNPSDGRFLPHNLVVIAYNECYGIHQHERLMAECFDKVVLVVYIRKGAYMMHQKKGLSCDHKVCIQRHMYMCENELADKTNVRETTTLRLLQHVQIWATVPRPTKTEIPLSTSFFEYAMIS